MNTRIEKERLLIYLAASVTAMFSTQHVIGMLSEKGFWTTENQLSLHTHISEYSANRGTEHHHIIYAGV